MQPVCKQSMHLLVVALAFVAIAVSAASIKDDVGAQDKVWRESYSKLNEFLVQNVKSDDERLNMRVVIEFYNDKYRSASIGDNIPMMTALETFIALPSIVDDDYEKSCSDASKLIASENVRGLGQKGQQRRIDLVVNYFVQKHNEICQSKQMKRMRTARFRI